MKFSYEMGFSFQKKKKNAKIVKDGPSFFGIVLEGKNACLIAREIWYFIGVTGFFFFFFLAVIQI